jgi:L-asparaginase II
MERSTVRREVVAACMESPFYFTLPLRKRLELMKQVEQQPVFSTLRQAFLGWIKTGILSSSE